MKKLFTLLLVAAFCSCNGPKDPPDDSSGATLTPDGIVIDTTKIPTTQMVERKIDSAINSKQ